MACERDSECFTDVAPTEEITVLYGGGRRAFPAPQQATDYSDIRRGPLRLAKSRQPTFHPRSAGGEYTYIFIRVHNLDEIEVGERGRDRRESWLGNESRKEADAI